MEKEKIFEEKVEKLTPKQSLLITEPLGSWLKVVRRLKEAKK